MSFGKSIRLSRITKYDPNKVKSSSSEYPDAIFRAFEAIENPKIKDEHRRNIIRRKQQWDFFANDPIAQKSELNRISQDCVAFINDWCWTYDPRETPSNLPFVMFPRQVEYIKWRDEHIAKNRGGVIEKSRDAGITWLNCASQTFYFLFRPDYKGAIGSRKEQSVDNLGDLDSIFEKIRFILQCLPPWIIRPTDYEAPFLKILNRKNGSSIIGEAGDNQGRGGRSTVRDADEAAFYEHAHSIDRAISQNSNIIFYTSTINGMNTLHAKKRFSGEWDVFTFHWKDDPRKNQEWYELQCRILDPLIVALEIDIDYQQSDSDLVIPHKYIQAAINAVFDHSEDDSYLLHEMPIISGLDVSDDGADETVLITTRFPYVQNVFADFSGTVTQKVYQADFECRQRMTQLLNYDCVGIGAGMTGNFDLIEDIPYIFCGVNYGDPPSDRYLPDFKRNARQVFANLKAELHWNLRRRFQKTYEHLNNIAKYPISELISIPNHPKLVAQLAYPKYYFMPNGKIAIESKESLAKRGLKSPDYLDALVLAHANTKGLQWL